MSWKKMTKRVLYLSFTTGLTLLLSVSWVHARLSSNWGQEGLELGRSLLDGIRLAQGSSTEDRLPHNHRITLNGSQFGVQTLSIEDADPESLERSFLAFRRQCQRAQGHALVSPELEELRKPLGELGLSPELPLMRSFIVESGNENERSAYCLRPAQELSVAGLINLVNLFTQSADLNQFGTWQGLYARREGDQHGGDRIALLSIETQGELRPDLLFPSNSDAPGADFSELPRPKGRRLLSLNYGDSPRLNTYAVETALGESLTHYGRKAVAAGLRVERPAENDTEGNALFIRTQEQSYIVTGIEKEAGSLLLLASLPD